MGSDLCRGVSPPAHFKPSPLGEGGWPSGQTDEGIVQGQTSLEKLCRAREGELPHRGKRSWPGPRPRRAVFGVSFAQGGFAACGRRVTLPTAAKSPKRRRGTRPMDYGSASALPRSIGPLTPGPHYGGYPLGQAENFRRAKSGVLERGPVRPHWGPERAEILDWCSSDSAPAVSEPTLPVQFSP